MAEPPPKRSKTEGRVFGTVAELELALPPLWEEDEWCLQLRCATLAARTNGQAALAVVDDDPTGTQTVHSVPVIGDWTAATLAPVLAMDRPCFYLLSNTRALPTIEAVERAEEIGRNLRAAAEQAKVGPLTSVVSRGDSTLRGHYPKETDALARGLGWGVAGTGQAAPTVVLAPFFKEGGRLTAGNVHYVAGPPGSAPDGSAKLTPAGETEFAKDRAFGYRSSDLAEWVKEKYTAIGSHAPSVCTIDLETIRMQGPNAVAEFVISAADGSVLIANAIAPRDMQVVALGCLKAEIMRGHARPLLYRSAGALVSARAAIPARPLLSTAELAPRSKAGAGLVVVGSYVSKSSDQLAMLQQECPWFTSVELSVAAFCAQGAAMATEIKRCIQDVRAALANGKSAVLFTSRKVLQDDGNGGLIIGGHVNNALCSIVEQVLMSDHPPAFLVAKGGITSNDVAVRSLGVRCAEVLGAVVPGVPAWRCGPETKAPGLAYVVFPGNRLTAK
eukprot:TRINITY_DN13056_c0_g1_i1.p1 TRINITY_DN13056_c0_g1~~TRINITY_DN13056_c0_g1_i1.p1  ORF type:complete len:502 (-),score=89.35 TRINITY_DN13056_c0_g1_i1:43-1548(-)